MPDDDNGYKQLQTIQNDPNSTLVNPCPGAADPRQQQQPPVYTPPESNPPVYNPQP